jgi:hypothetical protein
MITLIICFSDWLSFELEFILNAVGLGWDACWFRLRMLTGFV